MNSLFKNMKLIILLLTFPFSTFAQKVISVKVDSILVDSLHFSTYSLKLSNSSATDPAKVFVTSKKDFNKLKEIIPKYYFARKQEFNEYYILGVPDLNQKTSIDKALIIFLNHIDSSRLLRNRYTFRKVYTWDNINYKINYKQEYKELFQIDNLFYLNSIKDLCKYMICPSRKSKAD